MLSDLHQRYCYFVLLESNRNPSSWSAAEWPKLEGFFFVMSVVELNSTWKENSWSHPELNFLNWRNLFYENDVAVRERSGNRARKYLSRLPLPPNFACIKFWIIWWIVFFVIDFVGRRLRLSVFYYHVDVVVWLIIQSELHMNQSVEWKLVKRRKKTYKMISGCLKLETGSSIIWRTILRRYRAGFEPASPPNTCFLLFRSDSFQRCLGM